MKPVTSSIGAVFLINAQLLGASLLGITGWLIWPSSPEWWGFGLVSIVLGACAAANTIGALRTILKVYVRERELARLAATSRAPDPSDLADQNTLKNAGMLND